MNTNDFIMDLSDKDQNDFYGKLNKNIADTVFNVLKTFKFTPYNIEYGDTYFLMQGNPNSVIHFRVKEVWKHWKFGLWIHSENLFKKNLNGYSKDYYNSVEDLSVIEIFVQHDTLIDKFKPTASTFCQTIDVGTFKLFLSKNFTSKTEFPWSSIHQMLLWIKDHPFLAYDDVSPEWYRGKGSIKRYLDFEIKEQSKEYKELALTFIFAHYAKHKITKLKKFEEVDKVGILDLGEGWVSNPRITVITKFKEDVSNERVDEIVYTVFRNPEKIRKLGKIDLYEYVLRFEFEQGDEYICYD